MAVHHLQAEFAEVKARMQEHDEALAKAEAEIAGITNDIARLEAGIKKREHAISRKSSQLDQLNKKIQKMMADIPPGEDAGMPTKRIPYLCKSLSSLPSRLPFMALCALHDVYV
jgi:predicted  nucleic acid-binding Zn-ribbon protein